MTPQTARATRLARRLSTAITRDPSQIEIAQRLRYAIFSEEYGSDLGATTPGLDADPHDAICDHLMVIDEASGQLVATTRLLHQDRARQAGGFYSKSEFDLDRLHRLPGITAELGRTCVHPDYRSGATIGLLWASVAEYLLNEGVDYLIGCASISMSDGGLKAWRIARHLQREYLSDEQFRVTPVRQLPHLTHTVNIDRPVDVPALIKAYMRLGARVCGEPCWDPEFRCADLLVILEVSQLTDRYSRHFMRQPTKTAR
ncbi:GNAT family N-acetyltransferase [Marinobacter caseinilyticus]|uniref:GNAT family N-acetyltransferase n=1 Tax=Marinobacter caseinilyticus TaxID=2692195 RepID=UPI001408C288|nr:GNAT family N-acyltransferase [Marinobacter caseinilyticus]